MTAVDPMADGDDLAEVFAAVARALRADSSVQGTLDRIVELAATTIEGCDHAGMTMIEAGEIRAPAATDEVPLQVDTIQYETGEGPCVDAIRKHDVFQTDDLTTETRWPRFAPRAAEETGVRSILSYRLFVEGDTMGALNLYSKATCAFDDTDRAVGSIFAAHAAVALSAARKQEHLERAIQTRDLIGQAKGILMAREHVSADE
ncbi:MAG: GAF and ANTAR domain-containing protein, partial [Acidimicrobiales bacterium]